MPNPLMRVMLNNTLNETSFSEGFNPPLNVSPVINKSSINVQVQDKNTGAANLRKEQERLLKQILAKNKSKISFSKDDNIADKGIKLITLEELQKDYQRDEPAEEKNEMDKASKNLVSLASIGKLYREV